MNPRSRCSAANVPQGWVCALLGALGAFAGCTSTSHQLAQKEVPPPVPLNLTATQAPLEATLTAAIVLGGSGSWKKSAIWDEYLVRLVNRGNRPATMVAASVIDEEGTALPSGRDPWKLERQSRANWERCQKSGLQLPAKTVSAVKGSRGKGPDEIWNAVPLVAAVAALDTSAPGILPAGLLAGEIIDRRSEAAVEKEFNRRRLALPLTLPPGGGAEGSLFFPVTPGPQRLVLQCRIDDKMQPLAIDLAPLANLHLKTAGTNPSAVAGKASAPSVAVETAN